MKREDGREFEEFNLTCQAILILGYLKRKANKDGVLKMKELREGMALEHGFKWKENTFFKLLDRMRMKGWIAMAPNRKAGTEVYLFEEGSEILGKALKRLRDGLKGLKPPADIPEARRAPVPGYREARMEIQEHPDYDQPVVMESEVLPGAVSNGLVSPAALGISPVAPLIELPVEIDPAAGLTGDERKAANKAKLAVFLANSKVPIELVNVQENGNGEHGVAV